MDLRYADACTPTPILVSGNFRVSFSCKHLTKDGILNPMGKAKKRHANVDDPLMDYVPEFNAGGQLLASMLSIGWRLALTVLIPVFIGLWADNKFGTKPSFALAAFFIAIAASGLVIARSYKEINEQMLAADTSTKKKKKTVKKIIEEDADDY